jgi:EmrB/QacA subfamily drug resistance transporter
MTQAVQDRLDPGLRLLIGAVLLGGIMGILDGSVVAVAVDTLAVQFSSSLGAVGWVSTSYLLALTIAIPVTAWAVDRVGAKTLWLSGLVLFLAGSVASGLAWNIESLIAFRILQGLGAGILDPLMLILLARASGPERSGRVMGLMGVVGSSGPVLGPIVGGLVLQGLGWRWMFLINVPIGVVAFVLARRVIPTDPPASEREWSRLDLIGLALLGPGVAAVVLSLSQIGERGAVAILPVLVPLVAAVLLLCSYVIRALRLGRTPPLIDLRLFSRRSFAASVAVMALVGVGMFSSLFVLPLYYQQAHGRGALAAGLLMAPFGVGGAISMPLAGRLSDRFGSRDLALGGGVLALLSALAFTRIDPHSGEFWPALLALTMGLGLGTVGAPTMGSLYRTLPAPLVPQGSSVLYMLNQLGASIGIAVVALILQTTGDIVQGFHATYWWVAGAIVVMLAASLLVPGRGESR